MAKVYRKRWYVLDGTVIGLIVPAIPPRLDYALQMVPGTCIAGGLIRSVMFPDTIQDIDVFSTSKVTLERFISVFEEWGWNGEVVKLGTNKNAITYQDNDTKVQLIRRSFYPNPFKLLKSFDFTNCQAAVWYAQKENKRLKTQAGWTGIVSGAFLEDVPDRKLVYLAPKRDEETASSVTRMIKFLNRGYKIDMVEASKVIERYLERRTLDETTNIGWEYRKVSDDFTRCVGGGSL